MTTDRADAATTEIELPIEGMTCASCVNRIERFLSRTEGVETANVNLATEMATIRYLPDVAGRADLVGAVEAAGYDVREVATRAADAGAARSPCSRSCPPTTPTARARNARCFARRVVSIAVALAIMVAMFVPQTSVAMETINWLALVPATIIQVWAGAPVLSRCVAGRPAWHGQHGHARGGRHDARPGSTASS